MTTRKIRPVVLPLSDWSALDEIAGELKCMPLGGRTPDKPSVVTMLRLIARGELVVTRKVHHRPSLKKLWSNEKKV